MSSKSSNRLQYSSYRSRSGSDDKRYCDHRNYNKRRENQDHVKSRHRSRSRSRSYDRIDSHDKFSNKRNYNRDIKLSHGNEKCSQHRHNSSSKNVYHEPFPSTSSNHVDTEISKQIRIDCKEEQKQEVMIQSVFKNDGSFLEMFKQMHGQGTTHAKHTQKHLPVPIVGRRRGGKVLKTGVVEKAKVDDVNEDTKSTDPWAIYINEVKKYRQTSCQDEAKTRSLVK